MRSSATALGLAFALHFIAPFPISTSVLRPAGLPDGFEAIPLGWVRVTNYTHVESRSRVSSSGYVLKDEDAYLACAIGRDWWRSRVKPGDLIWVVGYAQPCVALDTMALKNRKGFAQTRWVDIYMADPVKGLAFGIQKSSAYILRPLPGSDPAFHASPKPINTALARRLIGRGA